MRLLSRIMLLILAVLVAWRIGPNFIDALGFIFPKFGEGVSYLMPDVSGRSVGDWFKFILAIVVFWLLLKALAFAFGFMYPKAQAYGTTKTVRRLQGLCSELMIILCLLVGVTTLDALRKDVPQGSQVIPQSSGDDPYRERRRELNGSASPKVSPQQPSGGTPPSEDDAFAGRRRKLNDVSPLRDKKAEDEADEKRAEEAWRARRPPWEKEIYWMAVYKEWMERRPLGVTRYEWQSRWTPSADRR